jgi:uroporphyrinogen decarboxylase
MERAMELTAGRLVRMTYEFERIPRLYRKEFYYWPEAIEAWKEQGLPDDYDIRREFMLDPLHSVKVGVDLGWTDPPLRPRYEDHVVRAEGEHEIIQDQSGRLLRVFKGRRHGFMPEYIKHAVSGPDDWERDVRPRLQWDDDDRWAAFEEASRTAESLRELDGRFVEQSFVGGYMYLRALIGPEGVMYAFYDQPELIHRMMQRWFELIDRSLERVQGRIELDEIYMSEDICYKSGLLISPATFREFLQPYYERLIANARRRQKRRLYVIIDSDGDVNEAIPLYLRVGMDGMLPFEVASGCDVVEIGRRHPDLIMWGGIDKRVLASGKEAIEDHLQHIIPPLLERGGYVPMCDHGVPPDVSLDDYLYYRRRACELGEGG